MKDKLKSLKLRRQNSTKSLACDLQLETEICRVGSVTSLKSLGKDLISSFKRKEDDNSTNLEEDNDSFQDGGGLTMKSKKIARRSLLRLRCAFYVEKKIFFSFDRNIFFHVAFFPKCPGRNSQEAWQELEEEFSLHAEYAEQTIREAADEPPGRRMFVKTFPQERSACMLAGYGAKY